MMSDKRACLGNYEDNPVSDLMLEAARTVGVDFILNVVTQAKHEIAFCAAGDVSAAWLEAVHYCEKINTVNIKQSADIVIAGCGGYPKDINMYQAQKALDNAAAAVRPGGVIIWVAECPEGLGNPTFEKWMVGSKPEQILARIQEQFVLGGHKAAAIARVQTRAEIWLVSSLAPELVRSCGLQPYGSVEDALQAAFARFGSDASIAAMPEGASIVPTVPETRSRTLGGAI